MYVGSRNVWAIVRFSMPLADMRTTYHLLTLPQCNDDCSVSFQMSAEKERTSLFNLRV